MGAAIGLRAEGSRLAGFPSPAAEICTMLRFWGWAWPSGDARGGVGVGRRGRGRDGARKARRRRRPSAEGLEGRALLAAPVAGTDYVLSGYQWADPAHITYSIAPDGVEWGHGINDLNAAFDAKFGDGTWQRIIALDLATWESVANLNISEVPDSALPYDTPGLSQGDPRFGDIRIGGYAFPGDTTTLADTTYPPPNGQTAAGDIQINTAMDFNIGSAYDLFSVMLHETGHSLGMAHATNPAEVMYPNYEGIRTGLAAGDIAGIQAMYGPRTPDAYQQQGRGVSLATAVDLTSGLGSSLGETVGDLSLATIGDTEYFSVVAPDEEGATLQVSADAGDVSMLSPAVTIYNASGKAIASASDPSAWSDDVTAQAGVVPGQRYYVAVTGATQDAFAVGAYQLQLAFTGGTPPATMSPVTTTTAPATTATTTTTTSTTPATTPATVAAASTPTATAPTIAPDRFEPNNTAQQATNLGTIASASVGGLNLDTAGDIDDFVFRPSRVGRYEVEAPGTSIAVFNASGATVASGAGSVAFAAPRARLPYYVMITSPGGAPVASYSLTIGPQVATRTPIARAAVHRLVVPRVAPRIAPHRPAPAIHRA
jgi:Matrixin